MTYPATGVQYPFRPYAIEVADVTVGQIVRNRHGAATSFVSRKIVTSDCKIVLDLSSIEDGQIVGVITFPACGGMLTTFCNPNDNAHPLSPWISDRHATASA